jgi:nitrogen fixation protein FixH
MKIGIIALAMLLAGCAATGPSGLNDRSGTSNTSSYNRDLSECEREAALASAGNKAQALDNCMRARKHTPKR